MKDVNKVGLELNGFNMLMHVFEFEEVERVAEIE